MRNGTVIRVLLMVSLVQTSCRTVPTLENGWDSFVFHKYKRLYYDCFKGRGFYMTNPSWVLTPFNLLLRCFEVVGSGLCHQGPVTVGVHEGISRGLDVVYWKVRVSVLTSQNKDESYESPNQSRTGCRNTVIVGLEVLVLWVILSLKVGDTQDTRRGVSVEVR